MMKGNLALRLAVSAALLGTCASASAVGIGAVAADHLLRFGGATATNGVLRDVFIHATDGICASGVEVYESTINQFAVACTAKTFSSTSFNAISGENIGYIKESNGGSGNGVAPVANQTTLTFLNPAAPTCGVTVSVAPANGLLGFIRHPACTGVQTIAPEVGIADVEGRLLGFTGSGLTPRPLLDIVFGIPVTVNLYRDLQTKQGLPLTDDCSAVPSLNPSQITGMYTGNVFDGTVLGLDAQAINVCRRGNSSGTQAGAKANFSGEGCVANVQPVLGADVGACTASGCTFPTATVNGVVQNFADDLVFAGSSSGEVVECLNARNGVAGDNYGIGVLSTENNALGTNYRFVAISGALPTLQGTASGEYTYFTSNVLNLRSAGGVYSADETAITNYVSAAAGSPSLLDGVNQPFRNGICNGSGVGEASILGDGGVMASSGFLDAFGFPVGHEAPYSGEEVRLNPINTQTRQPLSAINNCQVPVTHPITGAQ